MHIRTCTLIDAENLYTFTNTFDERHNKSVLVPIYSKHFKAAFKPTLLQMHPHDTLYMLYSDPWIIRWLQPMKCLKLQVVLKWRYMWEYVRLKIGSLKTEHAEGSFQMEEFWIVGSSVCSYNCKYIGRAIPLKSKGGGTCQNFQPPPATN